MPEAGKASGAGGGREMPCPGCGAATGRGQDNPWRPFCSQRCKMADLGNWLNERYRIPGPPDPDAPGEAEGDEAEG